MDAFAVEYIAVHDRRPLERPPQQRLRLLDGESETNRPRGYFPFAFTGLARSRRNPIAFGFTKPTELPVTWSLVSALTFRLANILSRMHPDFGPLRMPGQ